MTDWTPLRLTISILEIEGDDKYFDAGRCTADVKLNSGANIQLDVADPENQGSLHLKEQFDTLRITLKDKTRPSTVYGSVSFDAEVFSEHPVTKQWITLHSSALSDAFKGEIGKDERKTPRILLGYDAIPYSSSGGRGRTTAKRTKETSQLDRGSDDSRRKRSVRSKPTGSGGKFVVQSNSSRIVSHRDTGGTKVTKVEKVVTSSSVNSASGSARVTTTRSPKVGLSASIGRGSATAARSSTSGARESQRTSKIKTNLLGTMVSKMIGGLDHDDTHKEINQKTSTIVNDFNRETGAISAEETRIMQKLEGFMKSNAKLAQDENDLVALRNKAVKDLDSIKNEAKVIQRDEEKAQNQLIVELETLEQELQDIEAQLEDEEHIRSQGPDGQLTVGGIQIRETEQNLNDIKEETQMVLEEIRDAIKNKKIPIEESSFDPTFRLDLDDHAKDLIEKERERHIIELDIIELEGSGKGDVAAAEINEANLEYQKTQRDALQREYDRVVSMYDSLALDVKKQLDEETREVEDLRDYFRRLESDRNHFRLEIDHLKSDPSMTYSLDGGSVMDDEIRQKLKQVEDAERSRRAAEVQLDKLYDEWRFRIDRVIDDSYAKLTAPEDKARLTEIKKYIIEGDKSTRSLNALIADKEKLENLLYLRKTNHRLTGTVKLDERSFHTRMTAIKKEDRELMEELNKSDNALLSKNTALRELDDKIRILSRKYADLEAEAQEKKGLIASLRIKHDHIRLEIDRLRGLIDEDEIARLELELRQKEQRLRDLQAEVEESESLVVEWREKIILKQRLVKSRTQSRVLLFEPDPNDPIDTRIADYVLSHITTVPVKKLGVGKYLFGTKNIEVINTSTGAKVRTTTGQTIDLDHFLATYHDQELQKLDALGDNEELVVDEKDDYRYQENVRMGQGYDGGIYYGNTSMKNTSAYDNRATSQTFRGYEDEEYRPTTNTKASMARKARMY